MSGELTLTSRCLLVRRVRGIWLVLLMALLLSSATTCAGQVAGSDYESVVQRTQSKMVKIFGGGGLKGLEAYQSGFLISEDGWILTVWSYVLGDEVLVMLDDGERYQARVRGYDPRTEIALLKIEAAGLDHFNLDATVGLQTGSRVLAFSNLYGVAQGNEPTSVQFGLVSSVAPLSARRGGQQSSYRGPAYMLDAMTNNPGAAGGAVTNRQGRLAALIGKELRSSQNNIWINFAIPMGELAESIEKIRRGELVAGSDERSRLAVEPLSLELIGLKLVPEVVENTPPYIERVLADSVAEQAGLRPDDLLIEIDGQLMVSCRSVLEKLATIERDDAIRVTVQRDNELIPLEIDLNR